MERYCIGWQLPGELEVAGATYQNEVHEIATPDPIATCETIDEAQAIVRYLNAYEAQMAAACADLDTALTYLEDLRQALLDGDDYDIPLALATTNVESARERLKEAV